jgi:hypothetical protein
MRWLRVKELGSEYCYLVPDEGQTDRMVLCAIAAASFNSAWPEGYGWEQWDLTVEATVENARTLMPKVFRRGGGRGEPVLAMDYVHGRRCKTYVYRERREPWRGSLKLDASEYEAPRGDIERLLRSAQAMLTRRPRRRSRPA